MSALPNWIATRIDRNLDNTLTQEHVVETMVDAERPFFSARQLQSRVKPDVSKATVRNRLKELRELDVVATETYPDAVTLYYINYPESTWPLSPEGKRALTTQTPLDRLSVGVLSLADTVGVRPLVLTVFATSLALFVVGGLGSAVGFGVLLDRDALVGPVGTVLAGGGISLWVLSVQLVFVGLVLVLIERGLR